MDRFSEQEHAAVVLGVNRGSSIMDIARSIRRPYKIVYSHARRYNLIVPDKRLVLTDAEKRYINIHVKQGQSYAEIAKFLGRGGMTVRKHALEQGLRGVQRPRKLSTYFNPDSLDSVKQDYENGMMTWNEIAKKYKVSVPSIGRLARKYRWLVRHNPENPRRIEADKLIKRWYVFDNLSTMQIARKLQLNQNRFPWSNDEYVRSRLIAMGVKRRGTGYKNLLHEYYRYEGQNQPESIRNNDILKFIKQNYQNMNLQDMSRALKVDKNTIRRRADLLGIRISRRPATRIKVLDAIVYEYMNHPVTIKALSSKYDVSEVSISTYFKEHRVPIRDVAFYKREKKRVMTIEPIQET